MQKLSTTLKMENIQSLLTTGLVRHQAGDFHTARSCYEAVLMEEPDNVNVNFLLGTLLVQTKDYSRAEALLKNTLRLKPDTVPALINLGMVHQDQNDSDKAMKYYRAALQLDPNHIDVLNNMATLLITCGEEKEGAALLDRARSIAPMHIPTLYNYALLVKRKGNTQEAIRLFNYIVDRDPTQLNAYKQLVQLYQDSGELNRAAQVLDGILTKLSHDAELYYLRGEVLDALGRKQEAEKDYLISISLKKDYPEALFRLAMLRYKDGRFDDAIELLNKAKDIRPNFAEAYGNICYLLTERGNYTEAKLAGESAVNANPSYVDGYTNLGVALYNLADFRSALEKFEHALRLDPENFPAQRALVALLHRIGDPRGHKLNADLLDKYPNDAELHWNRALFLLKNGVLSEGWDEYEWGLKINERPGPVLPFSYWQGESLEGKHIVAVREQGIGDELMFISCIPDLIDVAAKVTVGCDPRLVSLFRRSFPRCDVVPMERINSTYKIPDNVVSDYYVRIGSLPRHFRREITQFPIRDAYLIPSSDRVAFWKNWLSGLGPGLKVGVCWRSGYRTPLREDGFTELSQWEHPFRVPGIVWINVQYGECEDELRKAELQFGVEIHRPPNIDQFNQLDDVSALMAALDIVVTAGTSVHVLAGAVGTATLLLGRAPIMSFGTPTEPWFRRVEQIPEHEKAVTLRFAARCLQRIVSSCGDKIAVNAVFTNIVRDTLDVSVSRPAIFVSNDEGDLEATIWKKYGEFSSTEEECFYKYVPKDGVVFDVGASVGIQTIKLVKIVGPHGTVRAFEADPTRWENLHENIVANRIKNVELYRHAVGCESNKVPVPRYGWQRLEIQTQESRVDVISLTGIASTRVDFVRIAGLNRHLSVLKSALTLLTVDRTVFYLIDVPIEDTELNVFLLEHHYRIQRHVVPWVRKPSDSLRLSDKYESRVENNLICIPKERAENEFTDTFDV